MNIEHKGHRKSPEVQEGNRLPAVVQLSLHDFLNPLFADPTRKDSALSPELVRTFTTDVFSSFAKTAEGENIPLQVGGTFMEVASGLLSPQEYWQTKKHFSKIRDENSELLTIPVKDNWRQSAIQKAITTLGKGDPDIDIYLMSEKTSLNDLLHSLASHFKMQLSDFEDGTQGFSVSRYGQNEGTTFTASCGPAYKGSSVTRLFIHIDGPNGSLFHIDVTKPSSSGDAQARNRRGAVGSVHDNCRGELHLKKNGIGTLTHIENNVFPKAETSSSLPLEQKDIGATIEGTLRETRKKLSHITSHNNRDHFDDFSLINLTQIFDSQSILQLREIMFDKNIDINKIINAQTAYQQKQMYQELFLMAQYDPYATIMFLQDTGMDAVFFGKHLNRHQYVSLLTSPYLRLGTHLDTREKSIADTELSRGAYVRKNPQERNGFVMFVGALGETFGEHKSEYESHLSDGFDILHFPQKIPTPLHHHSPLAIPDQKILYDTLKEWQSLTETRLHTLVSEMYPALFSLNDRDGFRAVFHELKRRGFLEVVNRRIKVEGEWKNIRFYCLSTHTQPIKTLLPISLENKSETETNDMDFLKLQLDTLGLADLVPSHFAYAWKCITELTLESIMSFTSSDWERIMNSNTDKPNGFTSDYFNTLLHVLLARQKEMEKQKPIHRWFDPERDE